jgi:hypothetical protein
VLGSGDDLPCESEAAKQQHGKTLEIEHAAHALAE